MTTKDNQPTQNYGRKNRPSNYDRPAPEVGYHALFASALLGALRQVRFTRHPSSASLRWRDGRYMRTDEGTNIELRDGDEVEDARCRPVHREQMSLLRTRMGAVPAGLRSEGERSSVATSGA
jgi:hypothetical protein